MRVMDLCAKGKINCYFRLKFLVFQVEGVGESGHRVFEVENRAGLLDTYRTVRRLRVLFALPIGTWSFPCAVDPVDRKTRFLANQKGGDRLIRGWFSDRNRLAHTSLKSTIKH